MRVAGGRRLAAAIALVGSLACPTARADVVGELPRQITNEVRRDLIDPRANAAPDLFDYGNLARGFMVYVLGKPFLFSEEDIDRIVGDPWRLNDATRVKLDALPPRLRLKLYSVLAGRIDSIKLVPPVPLGLTAVGEGRPLGLLMDQETQFKSIDGLAKSVESYFRVEELIDLVFYGISKQAFFPQTQESWKALKVKLPRYDLALGLVALGVLAAADEANVDMGGWLLKAPNDAFRFGWYAAAKHVGVNWHPRFMLGVQGAMPGVDSSLNWIEWFNPDGVTETRSIEWIVREHFLTRYSSALNWETSGSAMLRFVWEHTDPSQARGFRGQVDFYARRPSILERPQVDLLVQATLASDFRHRHQSDVSFGAELPKHSVAGAIRFTSITDPFRPTEWHTGLLFGGSVGEGDDTDYYRTLEEVGREVRDTIDHFAAVEVLFCDSLAATRGEPADPLAADKVLTLATQRLDKAAAGLKRASRRYHRARQKIITLGQFGRLIGPMTEEEAAAAAVLPGPLSEDEVRFMGARLASGARCPDPAVTTEGEPAN